MFKRYWLIPVFILGLTQSGWAADPRVTADQFPLVLEVEQFSIQSGRIVRDQDAGNGKAVFSESLNFSARIMVVFKEAGQYLLTLYEKANAGSEDSIHIKVNNDPDIRTYPHAASYGAYGPCKNTAPINLNEPGNVGITLFTTNEFGSYYDKVVINKIN